jgi:hypothetical protein
MPSFRSYVANWITEARLKTLEISDGKMILETKSSGEESAASPSPTTSPSPSLSAESP